MSCSTPIAAAPPTESETRTSRADDPLETCDALIIALDSQRIVILRRDEKIPMWSAEQICRPIRQMRRGEPVYYKGKRDVVRAIAVY